MFVQSNCTHTRTHTHAHTHTRLPTADIGPEITNKSAIVDSNFAPGGAICRTRPNVRDICNSGPLCENVTSSTKPEVHNICVAVRGWPSHGHRYNMDRKLREIRSIGFEICERTERQTDKQTYTLIAILRLSTGGEVTCSQVCDDYYY